MSRIGRQPIQIPANVTVNISGREVVTKGPKGELKLVLPEGVTAEMQENVVRVGAKAANLHGLFRTLIANNVRGVNEGWNKILEVRGTGYRAASDGTELNLALGFSHPVKITAPAGITFAVAENKITVAGADKALVGEIAAKIRVIRPPDPYKGKGIRYEGEIIKLRPGKAAKAGIGGTVK